MVTITVGNQVSTMRKSKCECRRTIIPHHWTRSRISEKNFRVH